MRYNLYRCAQINASAAAGYSSAQAMEALEQVFGQTMPPDMGSTTWVCLIQEQKARQGVPPFRNFWFLNAFLFSDSCGALRELDSAVQCAH